MEAKLQPIPVTIYDLLVILVPGFVWLILGISTPILFDLESATTIPPVLAWNRLTAFATTQNSWFAPVALVLASLLIGCAWKPHSMSVATIFTRLLLKLRTEYRNVSLKDISFPYTAIFRHTVYYQRLFQKMEHLLGCPPDQLYGSQLFAVTRSYLRIVAPALSDVAERREAEIRMTGALFLASLYSALIGLFVIILKTMNITRAIPWFDLWSWFIVSVLTALILADGFNRLRLREVGYVYTYALVVLGYQAEQQRLNP